MPPSATPSPHILLVEDEDYLRELLVDGLQEAGFEVFEAGDGGAGIAALQSARHFDLLLSDIKLPDIDGYRVAEAGTSLRPGLKVILMTGYAPSPLPATLRSQVYQVLQKPFSLVSLPDVICAALEA